MPTIIENYRDSSELLQDPQALRQRAEEDGYLCIRQAVPAQDVLELRRQVLDILRRWGYVAADGDPFEALACPEAMQRFTPEEAGTAGVGVPNELYAEVQRLEAFHRMAHQPGLLALYHALLGEPLLVHPRHIMRLMLPTRLNHPTPPHQDFIHIQGTRNVWTCWMPLTEVTPERGGLSILAGSHAGGLLPVRKQEGAGGLEAWLCDCDYDWVQGPMQPGDILTFPSLTVHKSLPNLEGTHVRLSCDFRYQRADEPVDAGSLLPHGNILPWEEIYRDWQDESLQYYWQGFDLDMSEWDESVRWQKENIC